MESVMNVAAYISNRFYLEYGQPIDEMKLHKLMYFAQRESFVQYDKPLFNATFYGWKYGPILKDVRNAYINKTFPNLVSPMHGKEVNVIMDKIFEEYAGKSSWSLSRLTHGELSWQNSRAGIPERENSDNPMDENDIRKDAVRIKERREMLAQLGFI